MRVVFIENTDEKYSITEDGEIINNKSNIILKPNTKGKTPFVDIYVKGKSKRIRPNLLMPIYFGIKKCLSCLETKEIQEFRDNLNSCKSCENIKTHTRKKEKGQLKIASDLKVKRATKSYIANRILKTKVSEMPDEMYQEVKQALLFKRKVAKEHNINYQLLS